MVNFIVKSMITITDPTCLRQFWIVFWAIYYKFFHWFFFSTYITGMILMIINNLPRIVILLPSSLIHKCWYSNSRALFFSSYFFKLHSLHDFASLTSLFLSIWWNFDLSLKYTFLCFLILSKHFNNRQNADHFQEPSIIVCTSLICMCKMFRHLNQCFIVIYSRLIFVWFLCAQNCTRNSTPQSTFFNSVHITYFCVEKMSWHLNQRFIVIYSRPIFVWLLCAQNCTRNPTPQSTFFNSVRITYFCMRKMSQHLNQRFIMIYSRVIFVWFLCAQNCTRNPHLTSLFLCFWKSNLIFCEFSCYEIYFLWDLIDLFYVSIICYQLFLNQLYPLKNFNFMAPFYGWGSTA